MKKDKLIAFSTKAKEKEYSDVVPFLSSIIKDYHAIAYVFVEHEYNFYQKYGKALSNLHWENDKSILRTNVMCEKKAEDINIGENCDYIVYCQNVEKVINMKNVYYWIDKLEQEPGASAVIAKDWSIEYHDFDEGQGKKIEADGKSIYLKK